LKKKRFTKASEFAQWEYCPRQWYFSKTLGNRMNSEASRRGVAYYNAKSEGVKSIQQGQAKFIIALAIGGIVCIFFFLVH
jgi:hypothetical protein